MDKFQPNWFFYMTRWDPFSEAKDHKTLFVYKSYTDDPMHTIGEMYSKTIETIYCIDYNVWTPEMEQFWLDEGFEIYKWKDYHVKKCEVQTANLDEFVEILKKKLQDDIELVDDNEDFYAQHRTFFTGYVHALKGVLGNIDFYADEFVTRKEYYEQEDKNG